MPISTKNEKVRSSVKHYALYRTFERALEHCKDFGEGGLGTVCLIVPPESAAADFKTCAVALLFEGVERDRWDDLGYICISSSDKPEKVRAEFNEKCARQKRAVVLSETRQLPALVSVAVDDFIEIEPLNDGDLREACAQVLRLRVTLKQARQLLAFPRDLMFAALKKNSTAADAIRRLAAVSPVSGNAKPLAERSLRLEELHGYGAAKDWGLQLAKDLAAWKAGVLKWSEIDRGLLLSGPPGVGKTIFAKALAETCGVNFVATSVAQWQATGHLGDLLKAMRADFATAVDKAPSILFLDELDSIGDRSTFTGEYASYSIQVVNGLLEALDGSARRDGLVVIGATNYPEKVDAAVRRPGRLDRHCVIGMPSAAERVAIVEQMLGQQLSDLDELGPMTEAMSGADLALMVRDAKKQARREERQLVLSDLTSQLPDLLPITGDYRHAIAVHEAGHAIVGNELGLGRFLGVGVVKQLNPRFPVQSAGGAIFEFPTLRVRNAQQYRDDICLLMAGIAAERVIFGSHVDGCGIGPTSDLALATDLAVRMETRIGMGSRLSHFGQGSAWEASEAQGLPRLVDSVEEILRSELARAFDIVSVQRSLLIALANELEAVGSVTPSRFNEIKLDVRERYPPGRPSPRQEAGVAKKSSRRAGRVER